MSAETPRAGFDPADPDDPRLLRQLYPEVPPGASDEHVSEHVRRQREVQTAAAAHKVARLRARDYAQAIGAGPDGERPALALHPAALHGPAGACVRAVRPHTEACDAAVLAQLLALLGCAVGPRPHVAVGADRHPARLFPLVVGSTGRGRKGTAYAAARCFVDHPRGPRSVLARVRSNVQSGEAVVEAVRDGDGADDPGAPDKRLFALETEFGNVLAAKGRAGSILTGVIRQAWDSDSLHNTKIAAVTATGAHVVFNAHVTEEELLDGAGRTDVQNGFLNRFLFVHSEQARSLPLPEPPPEGVLNALADTLSRAVTAAKERGRVTLSADATALWVALYPHLDTDDGGAVGALLARGKPYLLRLALVYALLDRAAEIEPVHVQAAAALWDYHTATVRRVYGARAGDPVADRVLEAVSAAPDGLTRTEVSAALGRHVPAAKIDRAVDGLRSAGLVTVEAEPTGGRPTTRVRRAKEANKAKEGPAPPLTSLLSLLSPFAQGEGAPASGAAGPAGDGRAGAPPAAPAPPPLAPGAEVLTPRGVGRVTAAPEAGEVSVEVDGLPCRFPVDRLAPVPDGRPDAR